VAGTSGSLAAGLSAEYLAIVTRRIHLALTLLLDDPLVHAG
jgi:hypothetical protein